MINMARHPDDEMTTDRVILRVVNETNAYALLGYYAANRTHLQPWEPARSESFYDLDAITERLRVMAHQTAAGNALHLVLLERESGELIGDCNFTNVVRGPFQACHLGFSIAKAVEGKGLMR
ncbi:GNAT family N-acetyltransferase [Caballeronia sp.]|uniref:GNAT family N-acetyltransferase n=1 Tax=Caballeronia sp. TaxID=1931223 RepID=UPI003C46CBA7